MKSFQFRLERVLELRRTQLEIEESRYQQCLAAVAALDHDRAELEASGIHAEVQVRKWNPIVGTDLAALAAFRGAIRTKEKSIAALRDEAARKAAAQMTLMMEAQRRCRLMERLKERRLVEWRSEEAKELETLSAESYLARWTREQR